jgi:sulfoxide reductase heme-binding subunit YedZ
MNSHAMWYLTRGSGIVALILLTFSVLAGITTVSRWTSPRWPRFVVEGLHRNISLLSTVFVVVHIASSVLDSYVPLSWVNAIWPFGSAYKPLWVGLGALAVDLFIAVAVTSLIRVRLGQKIWRGVHWLAYGSWGLALLHGLGIGSDRHQPWMIAINVAAIAAVTVAVIWRTQVSPRRVSGRLAPAANPQGAFR